MNKRNLALTLGGTMATLLTASPLLHAQQNPFGMQKINAPQMFAEADKVKEGKCGEAKCGANKEKMKEAKCGADKAKMKEAKCGADKAKMSEAKCGADKTKETDSSEAPK
ncbi:hypothetical protein [Methylomonas sp. AM2-LC]|uniref:HvfA family oxazolone/thioamide-modified RiPP metallophore n=1 Tax=Methylomonas sp. AM2-LC TaxID=3153301 RepID=UPI003267A913